MALEERMLNGKSMVHAQVAVVWLVVADFGQENRGLVAVALVAVAVLTAAYLVYDRRHPSELPPKVVPGPGT